VRAKTLPFPSSDRWKRPCREGYSHTQPGAVQRRRGRCASLPQSSRRSPEPEIYRSRNPPYPLLFLTGFISMVFHSCMAGYNTCPRAETFYSGNDGDDQIWNFGLARGHRGGFYIRERSAGHGGYRRTCAESKNKGDIYCRPRYAILC